MKANKEKMATICFWVFFIAMLLIGRYTYQHYGITVDEECERQSAFVNYQYVYECLTGQKLELFDIELDQYRDRYYGVALQIPMAVMEHLTGFTMPIRDCFLLRHLYTFLLCMGGWFCFYHFCRIVFRNRWIALIGMLMVTLYPRFWGEQFTNIKDMVFAATCCASMLSVSLCLEHDGKWRYEIISAFLFAICSNTRMIGFMFPALLFGYRLLRDWLLDGRAKHGLLKWVKDSLLRYLFNLALTLAVYFLLSPASWKDPIGFLVNAYKTFSNYTTWNGIVPFMDRMYLKDQLPSWYLVTWVAISVPLWYLFSALCGLMDGTRQFVCSLKRKRVAQWLLGEQRYLLFCLVIAGFPLLVPFVKEVTLYNSWRHMYFVFPALVVLALFGLYAIKKLIESKKVIRSSVVSLVCILLGLQCGWIVVNHPYEKVFFNPLGRQYADRVDRDYWGESAYHALQVILQNDSTDRISLSSDWIIGVTVFNFLPEEQMNRFYVYYSGPNDVDYYIDAADTVVPECFEGYTPVYETRMRDGLLLSTIFVKNEVLQERFAGAYPGYNLE